jgi:hypothetical protein
MSTGKSGAPETSRIATTFKDHIVEMRRDWNGLHSWVAPYPSWVRFDMGHSGPPHKGCPFHPRGGGPVEALLPEAVLERGTWMAVAQAGEELTGSVIPFIGCPSQVSASRASECPWPPHIGTDLKSETRRGETRRGKR